MMTNIADEVRDRIRAIAPAVWRNDPLAGDLLLGQKGIGLDSISMLDLLLACETQFGIPFREDLLQGRTLTVAGLIDYVIGAKADAAQ